MPEDDDARIDRRINEHIENAKKESRLDERKQVMPHLQILMRNFMV